LRETDEIEDARTKDMMESSKTMIREFNDNMCTKEDTVKAFRKFDDEYWSSRPFEHFTRQCKEKSDPRQIRDSDLSKTDSQGRLLQGVNLNEVYELYFEEKHSLDEIAERLGFKSRSPIRRIFQEQGWESRPKAPKIDIDPNEIHRLYFEERMSLSEVANYFGYKSSKPISNIMRKMGWSARPYSTPMKDVDPDEVNRLYFEEELSLQEVAEHFGYKSRSPIERILKLQGWESRPSPNVPRIEIDPNEVYQLYFEENYSLQKLADYFGCKSTGPIKRTFREQGWSVRPKESSDIKEVRDQLFGKECAICNSEREIIHRKDGQSHSGNTLWTISGLASIEIDEWVALCRNCHEMAHALMRNYDIHWEEIENILKRINSEFSN
jgi:predicted DNA-binding protein YlxM (UPF0122 family)